MSVKCRFKLEVDLSVVVAALEQLLHLLLAGLAGIRAGAGIADGVLCDLGQTLQEHFLGNKALLGGVGIGAVVLDAVGDVQRKIGRASCRERV